MAYYQQYESQRCGDREQNYGCNQSEYNYGGQQMYHSLPQGQIVKVCSKANPDYALGIRDGRATLVYYNPSDPTQVYVYTLICI